MPVKGRCDARAGAERAASCLRAVTTLPAKRRCLFLLGLYESAMSDLIQALLAFSLPPISERERYTFQTAPLVLVSTFPLLLASYLRLRRPHFPFLAKLVILLAGLPIVSHFLLKRYYVAVWYDTFDNTPYSLNHLNFVCGMAIGFIALKHIELLFLEKDSDFEVKGWEEYSKEQGNGVRSSASPSEPYTLRRPALFPGLTVPLEVDLVMSIRGQGYNWGAKKSTGGYKAMVQSQQLEKNPKLASEYKWSHIRRIGLSAVTNVVLMDLCDSIIKDTRIFPPAGRMGGGPIAEAANGGLGQLGPIISECRNSTSGCFTLLTCLSSTQSRWLPVCSSLSHCKQITRSATSHMSPSPRPTGYPSLSASGIRSPSTDHTLPHHWERSGQSIGTALFGELLPSLHISLFSASVTNSRCLVDWLRRLLLSPPLLCLASFMKGVWKGRSATSTIDVCNSSTAT